MNATQQEIQVVTVEVHVPAQQVEAFEAALTGKDDDIILAAEKAMRERVGHIAGERGIELHPIEETIWALDNS